MELSDIFLKRISSERFVRLHDFWYQKSGNNFPNKTEILTPVQYGDYLTLLDEFMQHKYADRISVNDGGKWKRFYKRKMGLRDVAIIAQIAKEDPFKVGPLELYFKVNRGDRLDDIKIKFVEKNGVITGYELVFPRDRHNLFTWKTDPVFENRDVFCLWLPPQVA